MKLDFDKFEQETYRLCALYQDIKNRDGAENPYNSELVHDALNILEHWEKILILSEIDEPEWTFENIKIISTIKEQMNVLKTLRKIYAT